MTLENLAYLAEIIGVIAVVASLVFVGIQVKQNTAQAKLTEKQMQQTNSLARAELSLAGWTSRIALQRDMYATQESADFMARVFSSTEPFTPGEKMRLNINISSLIATSEAAAFLHDQGLMDQQLYDRSLEAVKLYFQSPRIRKWWRDVGSDYFVTSFAEKLNEVCDHAEAAAAHRKEGAQ